MATLIPITNMGDVGKIIRSARKDNGVTQADLAGVANVGNRFISELENGKPTMEFDKVANVMRLMGFDLVAVRRGG